MRRVGNSKIQIVLGWAKLLHEVSLLKERTRISIGLMIAASSIEFDISNDFPFFFNSSRLKCLLKTRTIFANYSSMSA
jgi:hypothetical protein